MTAPTVTQVAFSDLLRAHAGVIYKVANAYCRHPDDRPDLVQEICLQLWRSHPSFDGRSAPSTWIHRVAINVAISYFRGQSRRIRHTEALDETSMQINAADALWSNEASEDLQHLHQMIGRLDDVSRAVVLLFMEGYPYNEIAQMLGTTPGNIATRVGRIKQRLQKESRT